jgi:hypothetical protein
VWIGRTGFGRFYVAGATVVVGQVRLEVVGVGPDGDAQALAALRRSAEQDPEEHLSRLAAALRAEALGRAEAGDRAGALLAGAEAVAAYAGVLHPPAGHDVALAGLLEAMARWFTEDGLDEAAAATAGDAVSVYIGLDEEEPGRHGSALARALSVHSVALWRVGEGEYALVAAMEAVDVLCDGAAPGRAGPSLKPCATTPDWPANLVGSRKPRRTDAESSTSSPTTPTAARPSNALGETPDKPSNRHSIGRGAWSSRGRHTRRCQALGVGS